MIVLIVGMILRGEIVNTNNTHWWSGRIKKASHALFIPQILS